MSGRLRTLLVLAATVAAAAISVPVFAQASQTAAPPVEKPQPVGEPPAGWSRRGDTGVTPFADGKFAFGIQ